MGPFQLPNPGPPSSVSILDPAGNTVLTITILSDGRLDVTGDPARWTDAARLFLESLRSLSPIKHDEVDQYTIDRARGLADARTDAHLRSWFRMTPGEAVPMAATFAGENLTRAALVSAQTLLSELASLLDQSDRLALLARLASEVADAHTNLTDALSALMGDTDPLPALACLGEQLDSIARQLPPAG